MPVPEGRKLVGSSRCNFPILEHIWRMASIIKLEDGSDIYASNIGVAGALAEIGAAISDTDVRLSRWLLDVSERTAPFTDFDLRGLSPDSRASFWLGVERANEKFSHLDLKPNSWAVGVIRMFYERRAAREVSSPAHVSPIDLDEIWFDDELS
jgi:hypothetical protein